MTRKTRNVNIILYGGIKSKCFVCSFYVRLFQIYLVRFIALKSRVDTDNYMLKHTSLQIYFNFSKQAPTITRML